MKKSMLVTFVMAFLTLVASSSGFAAETVPMTAYTGAADTTKEGSLLVWPLVQTNGGNETYIVIMNSLGGDENDTDQNVHIKCYWEYRPFSGVSDTACGLMDTAFTMSENNPLVIKASDGTGLDGRGIMVGIGEDMKGALKCWAVDSSDRNQISWNHLSGYAYIVDTDDNKSAWQYSAWRFAANILDINDTDNETTYVDGFWVGKTDDVPGSQFNYMRLKGAAQVVTAVGNATPACPAGTRGIKFKTTFPTGQPDTVYSYRCVAEVDPNGCAQPYEDNNTCYVKTGVYDGCPKYLTFDFLAEPSSLGTDGYAYNQLALLPCKEDLRYDGEDALGEIDFVTRLSFSIWNQNEVKYTGTQYCAHCNGSNLTGRAGSYERYLGDIYTGSLNFFQAKTLHTPSGRFRVEGLSAGTSGICGAGGAKPTPLIGVMASRIVNIDMKSPDIVGTTPSMSAPEMGTNFGWIKWDPAGAVERKKR